MFLATPMTRVLDQTSLWAAVVLINSMIMTIFLWHSTAMILVIGAVFWLLPELYLVSPGTTEWWIQRPIWIGVYSIVSLPLVFLFARFENSVRKTEPKSISLLACSCIAITVGIGYLAKNGFGAASHWTTDVAAFLLVLIGIIASGSFPLPASKKSV